MDAITTASVVVGLAGGLTGLVGGVAGGISAYVNWRAHKHTVARDRVQDYFAFFKDDIANLEKACEEAKGTTEEAECKHTLKQARQKFHEAVEAWQKQQELAAIVPPGMLTAGEPKLTAEEIEQVRGLLAGSARLPARLLSAADYFTRGNAYYQAEDYQQALEAYNRSLELVPDNPVTLYNRGTTLAKMGQHEDALNDFNRALELRPDLPESLSNRGNTLHNMGRYEEALKDFNRALQVRPDDPFILINLGATLTKMGQHEDALKDFNRALQVRPDDPLTLTNRSCPLIRLGRYEEALNDCDRALEFKPGQATALYNRACTYSLMGLFEDALRDLEAAIKGDEKLREVARKDEDKDFEKLRNDPEYDPRFRELVGE